MAATKQPQRTAVPRKPVEIRYEDLIRGDGAAVDLSALIEEAFGKDGLGLLSVSGVPGVRERRQALLPLAWRFAGLPEEAKRRYEHAASFYSFGWSHGKEKLQGRPDTHKGSYYANPVHDAPTADAALVERYPAFYHPNIWPREELPELEHAFKAMGGLIVEVGTLLARHCDAYVRFKNPAYPSRRLESILRESKVAKGRLLHYFPMAPEQQQEQGSDGDDSNGAREVKDEEDVSTWCGWHNDHGSLTGLTPAMYLDADGREVDVASRAGQQHEHERERGQPPASGGDGNASASSGLFVLSRSGELVRVVGVPSDHLLFQIGETAEIHSGGILQATPHAVKGGVRGLSRETFAVFMEPEWAESMDPPGGPDGSASSALQAVQHHLPKSVPPLHTRWAPGMNFAEFTSKTLASYY